MNKLLLPTNPYRKANLPLNLLQLNWDNNGAIVTDDLFKMLIFNVSRFMVAAKKH
ncbi:MAG: hypothetical protein WCP69_06610 [Bacteroidota bacterium]